MREQSSQCVVLSTNTTLYGQTQVIQGVETAARGRKTPMVHYVGIPAGGGAEGRYEGWLQACQEAGVPVL